MSANRTFKVKGKGETKLKNNGRLMHIYLIKDVEAEDKASAIINFLNENPEFSNSITCTYKSI
jgi:hypothetical protein